MDVILVRDVVVGTLSRQSQADLNARLVSGSDQQLQVAEIESSFGHDAARRSRGELGIGKVRQMSPGDYSPGMVSIDDGVVALMVPQHLVSKPVAHARRRVRRGQRRRRLRADASTPGRGIGNDRRQRVRRAEYGNQSQEKCEKALPCSFHRHHCPPWRTRVCRQTVDRQYGLFLTSPRATCSPNCGPSACIFGRMIGDPLANPEDVATASASPDEPRWPARIRALALNLRRENHPRHRERPFPSSGRWSTWRSRVVKNDISVEPPRIRLGGRYDEWALLTLVLRRLGPRSGSDRCLRGGELGPQAQRRAWRESSSGLACPLKTRPFRPSLNPVES